MTVPVSPGQIPELKISARYGKIVKTSKLEQEFRKQGQRPADTEVDGYGTVQTGIY